MSTADSTASSISGSKRRRAPLGYTPGASIFTRITASKRKEALRRTRVGSGARPFKECPEELMEQILDLMLKKNDGVSVIKLSMVNREFRRYIQSNWKVWISLYQRWTRRYFSYCSVINLPNFTRRPIPPWLMQELSRSPLDPERKARLLVFLRKLVVLHHCNWCGMCGSRRFKVEAYWSLGLCLCSHCLQDNLVSDVQLYERYFLTFTRPLAHALGGNTFFFWMATTPLQRTALTLAHESFRAPAGTTGNFYFWRTHLRRHVDMEQLEQEAPAKASAAATIRALIRRRLIMERSSKMRGYTLKDKRPIHTRLLLKELTKVPCTVHATMMTGHGVHGAFHLRQDHVRDTTMELLAMGQTRI